MKCITSLFIAFGILLGLTACQSDQAETETSESAEVDLKTALQGTWQTFQINVAVNSADGRDTFRTESLTEEVWEEVEEGEMPLWFHLPMHPEARLSDADKELLRAWSEGE